MLMSVPKIKVSQIPPFFAEGTRSTSKGLTLDLQDKFTQWMTEYEKLLRHIIIGFEAKAAIQEELFQEIALNIWRAIPSYRKEASEKTFVARIAHNVLATHVAKAVKAVKTESHPTTETDNADEFICQQPTPYHSLDQEQRQQRLSAAIRKLSLEQQQVITLALEGMSYQEMAETLFINTNLVGVRLQRAKTALATILGAV